MKKYGKIEVGLFFGVIFGILDIVPMIVMKLTWDTLVAAFSMCVIGGFLIATSSLKLNNIFKGMLVFFLIAAPMMIVVGAGALDELMPMLITNLVIGSLMGYFIGRFVEKQS